jgi:hypothetical protein
MIASASVVSAEEIVANIRGWQHSGHRWRNEK